MKFCSKCSIEKEFTDFYVDKSKKDGISSYCKICRKTKSKEYSNLNISKIKQYRKEYYILNKEEINKQTLEYYYKNKEILNLKRKENWDNNKERNKLYRRKYKKNRKQKDPLFKLRENLRNRLYYALKSTKWTKTILFSKYIGCDIETLKTYIESKFQEGMSWDNYTYNGWHIDHIIPLSLAKSEEELYKLCHYTNLQPLWAIDNIRKSNK